MLLAFVASACLVNEAAYERRKAELGDADGDSFALQDDCDDADASGISVQHAARPRRQRAGLRRCCRRGESVDSKIISEKMINWTAKFQ